MLIFIWFLRCVHQAAVGLTGRNFLLCQDSRRKKSLSTWPEDLHGGVSTSLPASVVASAAPALGPMAPLLCTTRNKLGNFLGLLATDTIKLIHVHFLSSFPSFLFAPVPWTHAPRVTLEFLAYTKPNTCWDEQMRCACPSCTFPSPSHCSWHRTQQPLLPPQSVLLKQPHLTATCTPCPFFPTPRFCSASWTTSCQASYKYPASL